MNGPSVSKYIGSCAPIVYLFPYSQNSDPPYMPCSVDWYLNQIVLHNANGTTYQSAPGTNFDQTQLPTQAFAPGNPLPYLEIPDPTATSPARLGNLPTANAYVHIRPTDESDLFDLQYWLFYAVRGRSTYRITGPFGLDFNSDLLAPPDSPYQGDGEHQGDWKHVTVRVNLQGEIQAIFYAQHGGGFWCLPGEYQTNSNGNPIVYSARNTHSCFPAAGRFNQMGTYHGVMGFGVSLLEWTADGGEIWDCSQGYQLLDADPPLWLAYTGQWGPPLTEVVNPSSFALLPTQVSPVEQLIENQIAGIAQDFIPNPETGADNLPQQNPWQNGDGDPPPPGWQPWSQIQPATVTQPGAAVTAVWRYTGSVDLFMTDKNGVVQWTWTDDTLSFDQQVWTPIQVNRVSANKGATVTALWRDSTHIDLFMTGTDGTVWWTWGTLTGILIDWQTDWVAIQNSVQAQPGATVTAAWRDSTSLDLWMTGKDGTVWWTTGLMMTDGLAWPQKWASIQNGKKAQKGAPVTALWRTAFTVDLFMTGTDGTVYWTSGTTEGTSIAWSQPWTGIQSNVAKANPGAAVTAVWRESNTILDLFMTGTDGTVWWTWGTLDIPVLSWTEPWTAIQRSTRARAGAMVTALWQDTTSLDLWMAGDDNGTDGTVYWTSTDPSMSWESPWASIQPAIARAEKGAPITTLWSDPDRIDIFMSGTDGTIWHSWLPVE